MQQRGRRSTASLSVVAGRIDGRPNAPATLSKAQLEVWDQTVAGEAAAMFRTPATQQLLMGYCRHVESANMLAKMVDDFLPEWMIESSGLDRYNRLLMMRDRETRAVSAVATKLRITNQSRYDEKTASTAAKASAERKPWEAVG
jgi:hypothetical protein